MKDLTHEREFTPGSLEGLVASVVAFRILVEDDPIPEVDVLDEKLH